MEDSKTSRGKELATKSEKTREELLLEIEKANDLLEKVMKDANIYTDHSKIRPSAIRGFDRTQEAHLILSKVDSTRENIEESI